MPEGSVRRYLVLVVGTLAGPGPAGELLRLSRQEPSAFHFVVPQPCRTTDGPGPRHSRLPTPGNGSRS
jgi:hypothetical protein